MTQNSPYTPGLPVRPMEITAPRTAAMLITIAVIAVASRSSVALPFVAATAQQCSEVAGSTGPDVGSGGEHGVGDDGGDRPPMTPADPRRYRHAHAAEQENYRASRAEAVTPSRGGHRISISSDQATKICSTVEPK